MGRSWKPAAQLVSRGLPLIAFLAASLAAPPRAQAADTTRKLLAKARREYALTDFDAALKTIERARPLARRGSELGEALALRAVVIAELRGLPEARSAFAEALREDGSVCPKPGAAKGNLVDLCAEVRREGRATVVLEGAGRGREIFLDDAPACTAPCRLAVTLGGHRINVRGRRPALLWQGRLPLDGRVVVSVPADAMDAPPATAPVPPPRPRARRLWTWVAAGAAAGLALASLGCWLGAESEYRSWQDLVSETPAPPDAEARLASLESATRRREIASWSLLGAAGAAAVVTAVLFWVEGRERRAPARVTARARGAGAVLGVSF